jgi:eukaryotic-like serine/threonine-protein kinase
MNRERWRQISAIFQAALARNPTERAAFVDSACRGDESLRAEVVSLMAAHDATHDFLESPVLEDGAGVLDPSAGSLAPGEELGPYRVVKHVATGGMGAVYLAQDTRLRRRVALKVLPAEFCSDEARVRRFEREARAASALNHPNIVTVYEFGHASDLFYMAAEYVEGKTLRERLKESGTLALAEALEVAAQVADALAAAHDAGVVHRDVKPENVMLHADGRVKVLDFGLAKFLRRQTALAGTEGADAARASLVTSPNVVMGTVKYMSPEQVRGQEVDERTDVWSLGCMLHEMITGAPAFDGPTPADALAAVIGREYKPPDVAPAALRSLLTRALAKDRSHRFTSASALADELRVSRSYVSADALGAAAAQTTARMNVTTVNGRRNDERSPRQAGEQSSLARRGLFSALRSALGVVGLGLAFTLILGATVLTLPAARRRFISQGSPVDAQPPFQTMRLRQLTDGGSETDPAISPDGALLAYVSREGNNQIVSVKGVSQSSEPRTVSPQASQIGGLIFSRDGANIYYVALEEGQTAGSIYCIPVRGGTPQLIARQVLSHFGLSADGRQLAFIRQYSTPDERQALIICDAEGGNERELTAKRGGTFFNVWGVAPSWSSDGRRLAVPSGEWLGSEETYYLSEVSLADGSEKKIAAPKWQYVDQVAWLADTSGLVVLARESVSAPVQVWLLDYPSGLARRVTNDLDTYTKISLTADARVLVVGRRQTSANIWLAPDADVARARKITSGEHILNGSHGMDWLPDGRLAYVVTESARSSLWLMDADGGNRCPLVTGEEALLNAPFVTPDGRNIIFSSTREAGIHVWSVGVEGSEPRRLTYGAGEDTGRVSPDGRWLVYAQKGPWPWSLWRKPLAGGEPSKLTDGASGLVYFSPDGRFILTGYYDKSEPVKNPWKVAILSIEGGPPLKLFDLPAYHAILAWASDGRSFYYIDAGTMNLYLQPLAGGPPRAITHFSDERVLNFALSLDGHWLALALGQERSDAVLVTDFRRGSS